jgi:hypothetical protein
MVATKGCSRSVVSILSLPPLSLPPSLPPYLILFPSPTRIGQLLATTLPSNRVTNENSINLYDEESLALSSEHEEVDTDLIMDNPQEKFGRFSGTEGKQRRAIILRNILLEVVLSLLVQEDGLNSRYY